MKKKLKRKMEADFRKKEEAKICPIVLSGNSEISKLCPYKDMNPKKCRSYSHFGCAHYKHLRSQGLI
ncbi:hypothetical protein K9M42_00670 [Patescibacteria group bacterium]|nr:hypothetical protein [Patescibacteria group bacterium]